MKRQHVSMIIALPAALLFAGAAGAQQASPTQSQKPEQPQQQMQPTQPAVPTTTQTIQCAAGSNCYDNNTTDRDTPRNGLRNGNRSFSALAGSKGYVTQSEASASPWLSSHFTQCDSNHDGKVTGSEYRGCTRQQGGRHR